MLTLEVAVVLILALSVHWIRYLWEKRAAQRYVLSHGFSRVDQVLARNKKILILAPHEDDEALMCSGVIAHALKNGADIKVVVVTNGDSKGREAGLTRIRETINAMEFLGLTAANITFLGYGDVKEQQGKVSFLSLLYDAAADDSLVASYVGTESYSIPEKPEYHFLKYGVHARYDRATFRQDLRAVILESTPDHIFVSSLYDLHPDHSALFRFTVESLIDIKRNNPDFSPVVHQYLIHARKKDAWPTRDRKSGPPVPFPQPLGLAEQTRLDWDKREIFVVPPEMQTVPRATNKKYQLIDKYSSQRGGYLYSFVKLDEFFWEMDFSNIAPLADVSVSSENTVTGQLGVKAIDGIVDGYPRFPANEWVTDRETAGAWIQLNWARAYTINKIILYDRLHPEHRITGATLTFSDGSLLKTGALPANGKGYEITFPAKTVNWVKMTVDAATGENTGLCEFEVYEAPSGDNPKPSLAVIPPI